ncbi:MAG: glycosyltransferase [Candidatus Bathyarchaeota archaeon]|nr:glycosyltransferase [Candidatus Bathyarchaeota archaeon]
MSTKQGISIVTTTWNERENIGELIRRIRQTLKDTPHEIIVIDDNSKDGTLEIAKPLADLAIGKAREGQTKGLLFGAKKVKFPTIVTIDSDLENSPELIPALVEKLSVYDVVVASRKQLPRFSEKWAAKTLGKIVGVSDFYSNFRAYKREAIVNFDLEGGETFGGELLILAKKRGFRVGEVKYDAPPRRMRPRIGGSVRANWRISVASLKCWLMHYL